VPGKRPKNPYRPGAAIQPRFLAGRTGEMARLRSVVRSAPELPANVRILGLRGVGKSVLLAAEEEIVRKELNWHPTRLQVEPRHNREKDLVDLLVAAATKAQEETSRAVRLRRSVAGAAAAVSRILKVSYDDIEVSLDMSSGTRQRDLVKALYDAADTALKSGFDGYLLMLDEAQIIRDEPSRAGEHPLSLLIAGINTLQEREVPVGLVMCGLPTLRANLLKARTYSERMFRGEDIGPLPERQAALAFTKPLEETGVTADDGLVKRVIQEVEGYPYFIQLWGAELWDAAEQVDVWTFTHDLLDAIEADIYRRLDSDFYEGRVEALTPAEADLLMSTADCPYPPLKTVDIGDNSPKSTGNINVLMGRLTDQGVTYRVQKGQYRYTAPKFYEFLQRRKSRLAKDR
jgi:hypothetical protein